METLIALYLKYLYDDIWSCYFFSKVLGRKYSLKVTLIILGVWNVVPSILKIGAMYTLGLEEEMTQILTWIGIVVYVVLTYGSTLVKKCLAIVLMFFALICAEIVSYIPGEILTGGFAFMQTDSMFTIVCILVQLPLVAIIYLILIRLWKYMENIEWNSYKELWLAVLLSSSQFCFIWHLGFSYGVAYIMVPILSIIGLVMNFLAVMFMFVLLYRSNQRRKAEKELRQLKRQYEMEKIRYEQLMENQEEIAKIRHDYQNHLVMIKNMV